LQLASIKINAVSIKINAVNIKINAASMKINARVNIKEKTDFISVFSVTALECY